MSENHCSTPSVSSLAIMTFHELSSSVVARSIVYYHDHRNLTDSFECFLIISARVVKHLWGDGRPTTFYADLRRDGNCTCKGMVYAKLFYGGWCCFPGGWHPPSTRVLLIITDTKIKRHEKVKTIYPT